jgi:hypothetical protein
LVIAKPFSIFSHHSKDIMGMGSQRLATIEGHRMPEYAFWRRGSRSLVAANQSQQQADGGTTKYQPLHVHLSTFFNR